MSSTASELNGVVLHLQLNGSLAILREVHLAVSEEGVVRHRAAGSGILNVRIGEGNGQNGVQKNNGAILQLGQEANLVGAAAQLTHGNGDHEAGSVLAACTQNCVLGSSLELVSEYELAIIDEVTELSDGLAEADPTAQSDGVAVSTVSECNSVVLQAELNISLAVLCEVHLAVSEEGIVGLIVSNGVSYVRKGLLLGGLLLGSLLLGGLLNSGLLGDGSLLGNSSLLGYSGLFSHGSLRSGSSGLFVHRGLGASYGGNNQSQQENCDQKQLFHGSFLSKINIYRSQDRISRIVAQIRSFVKGVSADFSSLANMNVIVTRPEHFFSRLLLFDAVSAIMNQSPFRIPFSHSESYH